MSFFILYYIPTCNQNIVNCSHKLYLPGQDLLGAEKEFRAALHEEGDTPSVHALYNLALTLYYRGKIRVSQLVRPQNIVVWRFWFKFSSFCSNMLWIYVIVINEGDYRVSPFNSFSATDRYKWLCLHEIKQYIYMG